MQGEGLEILIFNMVHKSLNIPPSSLVVTMFNLADKNTIQLTLFLPNYLKVIERILKLQLCVKSDLIPLTHRDNNDLDRSPSN